MAYLLELKKQDVYLAIPIQKSILLHMKLNVDSTNLCLPLLTTASCVPNIPHQSKETVLYICTELSSFTITLEMDSWYCRTAFILRNYLLIHIQYYGDKLSSSELLSCLAWYLLRTGNDAFAAIRKDVAAPTIIRSCILPTSLHT